MKKKKGRNRDERIQLDLLVQNIQNEMTLNEKVTLDTLFIINWQLLTIYIVLVNISIMISSIIYKTDQILGV